MSAHSEIIPPAPATDSAADSFARYGDHRASYGYDRTTSQRTDGWGADRQRIFLQVVSEGGTVARACLVVGLSKQSAYAFRNSARGAAFALGWKAAVLLARDALADELMDRAMNGVFERTTDDGDKTIERHRFDNRLAMSMLNRADKMAAAFGAADDAAARLIAQDFDQYLELIERDSGPARAGLFLGARVGTPGVAPATNDDLAPIRALARADRWLRTHTDLAEPLDTQDLDPAARADWSAEQWARAEDAGLLVLAPTPAPAPEPARDSDGQRSQHFVDPDNPDGEPVWWCSATQAWRTNFPPPEDFFGQEEGAYGDEEYSRALSDEEIEALEAPWREETEARRATEAVDRDRWFGFTPESAVALPAPGRAEPETAAETG